MLTGVVLGFARVVVMTNNLKVCTSASLEARVNATASTKAILGMGGSRSRVSGTGVANSIGAKDSVSFEGQNMMLPNTQSINRL